MRIIIIGDKSRYQFLHFLVNKENLKINDKLYANWQGDIDIFVSSDKIRDQDNIYYSSMVPLNSLIYFPREYSAVDSFLDEDNDSDRVLFFIGYPYNREESIKTLNKVVNSGKYEQLNVVLICDPGAEVETDVSSDTTSILSAEEKFDVMGIDCCRYVMGERPDFLYWKIEEQGKFEKKLLLRLAREIKGNMETFDSEYDRRYIDEGVNKFVRDPFIKENIRKYGPELKNKNIWSEYAKRSIKYLLQGKKIVRDFFLGLYDDTISAISSAWDVDADKRQLTAIVENALKARFDNRAELIFRNNEEEYAKSLNEEEYEKFQNNNQVISLLSQELKDFFEKDLKNILKNRINKDIKVVEELLDECDC